MSPAAAAAAKVSNGNIVISLDFEPATAKKKSFFTNGGSSTAAAATGATSSVVVSPTSSSSRGSHCSSPIKAALSTKLLSPKKSFVSSSSTTTKIKATKMTMMSNLAKRPPVDIGYDNLTYAVPEYGAAQWIGKAKSYKTILKVSKGCRIKSRIGIQYSVIYERSLIQCPDNFLCDFSNVRIVYNKELETGTTRVQVPFFWP